MKMGTTSSLWRYDDDAKSASDTTFMRCGYQRHCVDKKVALTN